MFWCMLIGLPGVMLHLLPLTTVTFCVSWLTLMISDHKAFNGFGMMLSIMCMVTLMLFAIRCIVILVGMEGV